MSVDVTTFETWLATRTPHPQPDLNRATCDHCGKRPPMAGEEECEPCLRALWGSDQGEQETAIEFLRFAYQMCRQAGLSHADVIDGIDARGPCEWPTGHRREEEEAAA